MTNNMPATISYSPTNQGAAYYSQGMINQIGGLDAVLADAYVKGYPNIQTDMRIYNVQEAYNANSAIQGLVNLLRNGQGQSPGGSKLGLALVMLAGAAIVLIGFTSGHGKARKRP